MFHLCWVGKASQRSSRQPNNQIYEHKGFTFCIDQPHNTIGSQRDRVYFNLNIFIIGLGAMVLFILGYLWYLAAHDASVSLFVGATVKAITRPSSVSFQASLSSYGLFITFQASLRGYGSFVAEYFARIRNSDFLLMAFLFISGPLLALATPKLVVTTSLLALGAAVLVLSFAALSHGYIFIVCIARIRAFLTFILILGMVLASSAVLLAVFSSFFAFVMFILILGELVSCEAGLAVVSTHFDENDLVANDALLSTILSLVAGTVTRVACSFQASLRGYGLFITVYLARVRISGFLLLALVAILFGQLVAFGTSLAAIAALYFTLYLPACADGFYFAAFSAHIRASHIRTLTKDIMVNDLHIAP